MTDWQTGTCKANGISIHYQRSGGDKPPVVLLHGLIANGACWTHLARILENDYDVIMPDARGHGKSDAPDHGYHYDDLAADVVSFIEVLDIPPPVLLGHSMGGMTAAVVASHNPKLLRGLILTDPTFLTPQRQREVHESDVANEHLKILNQPKESILAKALLRHSHRTREAVELFTHARFQTSIRAFEVLTPPNPDYMQLIGTISVPSLLIIGGVGAVVSPAVATKLAKLNPLLDVVQITEAGHGIPYDQPERFSAIVQAFLHSVDAGILP